MLSPYEQTLEKLKSFCAYQERTHQEVLKKMRTLGVPDEWKDEMICFLIEENYLNELRYAQSYVRGKFNLKSWGRQKIRYGLKAKNISDPCIEKAIQSEIDLQKYKETLLSLIKKKASTLKTTAPFKTRQKLYAYAASKGYESASILEINSPLARSSPVCNAFIIPFPFERCN